MIPAEPRPREAAPEVAPAPSPPVIDGPPCLICGKPIARPAGTNGRPRKVHEGDCQVLRDKKIREAFAPEPRPAPLAIVVTAAAPGPEKPRQFQKQCTVVDGYSGQRCGLLAPHDNHPHRTARGEFHQVLEAGAVPTLVRELVTAARRNPSESDTRGAKAESKPRVDKWLERRKSPAKGET